MSTVGKYGDCGSWLRAASPFLTGAPASVRMRRSGAEPVEKNDQSAIANLLKEREGGTWFNCDTQSYCSAFSLTRLPRHSPRHHPHRPYPEHGRLVVLKRDSLGGASTARYEVYHRVRRLGEAKCEARGVWRAPIGAAIRLCTKLLIRTWLVGFRREHRHRSAFPIRQSFTFFTIPTSVSTASNILYEE